MPPPPPSKSAAALTLRDRFENYVNSLAESFAQELQPREAGARFDMRAWQRPAGGGGRRWLLDGGHQLERVWIEASVVSGPAPKAGSGAAAQGAHHYRAEFALAIYPRPAESAAFLARVYYQAEAPSADAEPTAAWYGGHVGMVPTYLNLDEARHFHLLLQEACDEHHPDFYRLFKTAADTYFYLPYRRETLGVGGVHFDRLGSEHGHTSEDRYEFVTSIGDALLEGILPLLPDEDAEAGSEAQRRFQRLRQGRVAEFLLQHDVGVQYARHHGYPSEVALAGMPPAPLWDAAYEPKKGSPEAELSAGLRPTEWLADVGA
jgi:coproporphyrinogen III oxidase